MLSSRTVSSPGAAFAGSSYTLDERAFEALPREHPKRVRHREVERFRRRPLFGEQPRWNASVLDEAHRFPDRPIMHSLAVVGDAQVGLESFPEVIPRKTLSGVQGRSGVWNSNSKKLTNSRFIFTDALLAVEKKPKMSYFSTVVTGDFTEENKLKKRGWCSSTLTTTVTNPHRRWKETVDYVELNKTKAGVIDKDNYIAPQKRVSQMNERIRERKKQERAQAETQCLLSETHESPIVFKMSNIDDWWLLDPTLTPIPTDASSDNVKESSED